MCSENFQSPLLTDIEGKLYTGLTFTKSWMSHMDELCRSQTLDALKP
jgi:hypothetical protein